MPNKMITENPVYTSPIDTDVAPIVDITTNTTKKITWANIKATLKTYFDTLYATLTGTQTFTNKTLTTPVVASIYQDAGKTKLLTIPNTASDTLVALAATQTLTNKTLTSPVINTVISGTAIATGAEVTTGTDDTQIVTPKAIGDAGVNTRLKSKTITSTRDMTAANGDVAYTGVGFIPTSIICIAGINAVTALSTGFSDSAKASLAGGRDHADLTVIDGSNRFLTLFTTVGAYQICVVKTFDADGFTLTWTKGGSPTGTATLNFLCYR